MSINYIHSQLDVLPGLFYLEVFFLEIFLMYWIALIGIWFMAMESQGNCFEPLFVLKTLPFILFQQVFYGSFGKGMSLFIIIKISL